MTIKITRVTLLLAAFMTVLTGCGALFNNQTPLETSSQDESNPSDVTAKANPLPATADQPTALMMAAAEGDFSELQDLIDDGSNVNTVTPKGTALSWAIEKGQQVAALYLMSVGADPNKGIEEGMPSLLMAVAERGDNRLIKALLAAGADVNYADANGQSAIAYASYKGHLTSVKTLLKAGADVNVTPAGKSLLMHIVDNNDLLLAQVVIAAGADVNFTDDAGNTALKIAQQKGLKDLEMLLIQSGAAS